MSKSKIEPNNKSILKSPDFTDRLKKLKKISKKILDLMDKEKKIYGNV